MHRRLPIYILLDCSESMAGKPWDAVKAGLSQLLTDLRSDPMALEASALSLISFANKAQQDVPLTDICNLSMPHLKMGSGTALGAALRLWVDSMAKEVKQSSPTQKGDYKPVMFILTDGTPTDVWEANAEYIRKNILGKKANIIGVGCGPDADMAMLRKLTEITIHMEQQNEVSFQHFFEWVSASVSTASQAVGSHGDQGIKLPNLNDEMKLVNQTSKKPSTDRHVFLHARCIQSKKFFLYRFSKSHMNGQDSSIYQCTECIPIPENEFDFQNSKNGLHVSNSQLGGELPCPHCSNPSWGMCANGHVHCVPDISKSSVLTCPWCESTGTYEEAIFDVGSGAG